MKNFSKGVSYYTGATVSLVFPEDDLCCYRCPLMGIELKVDREYCKMTGEYLVSPRDLVGYKCPLVFDQEEEEHG